MSGFGNWAGADLGGTRVSSMPERWSNDDYKELFGTDKPDDIPDDIEWNPDLEVTDVAEDESDKKFNLAAHTGKLGETPGLISDNSTYDAVRAQLTGGDALNWEVYDFGQLLKEKNTLKVEQLGTLAGAWTSHGEHLKTESETFKKTVNKLIEGKWSGESAGAAEAASKHVTKTSIYDFAPSAEEISDRLAVLKAAFENIRNRFPDDTRHDVIEDFRSHNKQELDAKIDAFNSGYHFDSDFIDGMHLRSSGGGYVDVATVLEQMRRLKNSIADYHTAVQLFRDTYQPTVEAVVKDFPALPPPPNMKFDPQGPGGPGGQGGPGFGGTGLGGSGLGGGSGIPPFSKPNFDGVGLAKNPAIPGLDDLTDQGKTPITDPQGVPQRVPPGLTQGLKPAMDAATKAATSGMDAATKAAQQAAQAAGKGLGKNGIPSLREGALGLGDKAGAGKGGGAGAGGAGLGKGGPGVNQPAARLSAQPTTMASGARPAVPVASNAGMGAMGGPGMGGGPAAGQRGADGKEHKANKALKNRKNGADIVGDTDAVVPVLGDSAPADENEPTPAPPRRRIPQQRGPSWQTNPASGAQRPPHSPQPSSATPE